MISRGRPSSICVVLLDGIGDVVHGLPVVNALKDHDPRGRITWVTGQAPAGILTAHPSVDDVIVFRRTPGTAGVRELQRAFRGRRFDIALNLHLYFKGVLPTVLSGAPVRIGLDRRSVREGIWLFSNRHTEPAPRAHTQDMFLRFLDCMDVPRPDPLEWRIAFTSPEREKQEAFFAGLPGRPVVGLTLASRNASKDWPAERYAALAPRLVDQFGATVLLVGGAGERERRAARIVAAAGDRVIDALADDVRRLMWLIDGCDLLISPDSGPLHIAHALDVPVIGLYGHTNPARFGPYRRFEDLLIDRYRDPGEEPDPSLWEARSLRLERITVDDVLLRAQVAFDRYILPRRRGEVGPGTWG